MNSFDQYNFLSPQSGSRLSFAYTAAVVMAIDHFNNRNSSIVPEVANIDPNCSVYFTDPSFIDTKTDGGQAVIELYDLVDELEEKPCAVLGTVEGQTNIDVIPAANTYQVPLISYYTDDATFVTEKGTIGLTLSADGRARAMVNYLRYRQFLAFWYVAESERETALADALVQHGGKEFRVEVFRVETDDIVTEKLKRLRDSGIKTIFLSVLKPVDLYKYAVMLSEMEMLAPEYVYILPPEIIPTDFVSILYGEQLPGSPLHQLLSGALVFDRLDGFRKNPDTDKFLALWRQQGNETIDKMNSLVPKSAYYLAGPTYFQTVKPANFASVVYDSVMAVGFGACIAEKETKLLAQELAEKGIDPNQVEEEEAPLLQFRGFVPNLDRSPTSQEGTLARDLSADPSLRTVEIKHDKAAGWQNMQLRDLQILRENTTAARGTLLAGMMETKFEGASGVVDFGNEVGKERNYDTISIGLYNIRPENVTNSDNQTFFAFLTSTYNADGWAKVPNTEIVYRDGTTDEPDEFRIYVNENFLSTGVRVMGLFLMSIAWLLAFAALIALQIFTKDAVVQRAQPFFLKMLCYGSIIMSSAIFTLSWDEGAGWSDAQLDVACALTPWFFFVGQIVTFCALFTKLWRVDKVLQFRRRAVTISNVMKPSIALISVSMAILITWTIVDPWTWVRKVTSELPAERYGQCTSNYFAAWFGPLVALLFVAEILTMYFAWKTADIPNDFRDSGAVMYASFAQIQSWAIGVPMLVVLGTSSADATYFGRIFLIWIFAVSSVVVVVGPKLINAYRIRRNPELGKAKSRVHVSGLTGPTTSSAQFVPSRSSNSGTSYHVPVVSTNSGNESQFRSQNEDPEGPLNHN